VETAEVSMGFEEGFLDHVRRPELGLDVVGKMVSGHLEQVRAAQLQQLAQGVRRPLARRRQPTFDLTRPQWYAVVRHGP